MPAGLSDEVWDQAKREIVSSLGAVATAKRTISYSQLVQKLAVVHLGPDDPRLHAMLGEVSTEQDQAGRGMLSVLVVHKTGDMEPGEGFFKLAVELGRKVSNRESFWIDELKRVYAAWSQAKPSHVTQPNRRTDTETENGDGSVNQEQRAAAIWKVLTDAALRRETITYKRLAKSAGGFHHRVVQFPLKLVQRFCLDEKLPPLTSLAVHVGDARPGPGFVAWDADDIRTAQESVFAFAWGRYPNPFGYAETGTTEQELAGRLVENPVASVDVYQLVKVRGKAQSIFRLALLSAYDGSCAFCGLTFVEALDAAHIVPWAKCGPNERMCVNNGILLCSNHHEMLDADWLRIHEDFRIEYTDMAREHAPYSATDDSMSTELNGKRMDLPANKRLWPDPLLICRRNKAQHGA